MSTIQTTSPAPSRRPVRAGFISSEQTQASWRVDDVRAEVKALRARGVKVEEYDNPGFKTDQDGVVDIGFAWTAYIIDPDKNALSILQLK